MYINFYHSIVTCYFIWSSISIFYLLNVESLTYPSRKSWNSRRHFTFLKLCKCFEIPHPLSRVVLIPSRTKTNHHWLNQLKHSSHTKLCYLAHGRSEGKLSNPWGNKNKYWSHLPSSFHLINNREKKRKY